MREVIFNDKANPPNQSMLAAALGESIQYWEAIKLYLTDNYGAVIEDWKFYSPKYGWTLKVLLKKRNLFFVTPCQSYFRVAFVFGDKAVAAIEQSDLPSDLIQSLITARKYAEGRGVTVDINQEADVKTVCRLVAIKIAH